MLKINKDRMACDGFCGSKFESLLGLQKIEKFNCQPYAHGVQKYALVDMLRDWLQLE
jgi:hypothetical protein